jgi:type I restriction enzyme S subunit
MSGATVRLQDVVAINPATRISGAFEKDVCFAAMADVSETGRITSFQMRPLVEVSKGYTSFCRGDVLLAKITPCFENGKAAVVEQLAGSVGYGSTEFHVLRPSDRIDARFLFHLIWNPHFRRLGAARMTGSAGQKRVPTSFLAEYEFWLPQLAEQKRIAAILDKADSLRRKRLEAVRLADEFLRVAFIDMFGDPVSNDKGLPVRLLGEVCRFYAGNSLPAGEPFAGQPGGFLHIKVGDMNSPGNEAEIYFAREWSSSGAGGIIAPEGAILIPKRGGAIATNKKRVLRRPCALDPNLMAIGPGDDLRQEVLLEWFRQFDLTSISSGSAVPQLNKGDLAPLKITVPPLAMQDRFVQVARKVKSMLASQGEQLTLIQSASAALTSTLLHAGPIND